MDEDHAYRAMDLLVDADTHARVQEAVFFAVANLLNLEVDLLFFDTISTYFERDEEQDGPDAFRRFGHSKDHRPDLPQIVIGLAVTKEGIPVRCWCWPGNSNDQAVLAEVKDDLRDWKLGRVITVVDRGFSSADNLAYLRRAGGHYIAGMRMRDGNPLVEQVLSRQGRYQHVKDDLRVKEVNLEGTDARFVICHNPEQEQRDQQQRDDAIARIHAELARIGDDQGQRPQGGEQPRPAWPKLPAGRLCGRLRGGAARHRHCRVAGPDQPIQRSLHVPQTPVTQSDVRTSPPIATRWSVIHSSLETGRTIVMIRNPR
jgi:hypothetical protein